MSTEPHGIARDQLRAFIERVERVEEEIAALNTDKSDIYKEARAVGFDVKVLRKVVAKRKLETHVREEQDAIFDMYWDALYGAPVHVHTHTRENIEKFGAINGGVRTDGPAIDFGTVRIMEEQREVAMRSDAGLNIVTKHTEIIASDGSPSVSTSLAAREAEESAVSHSSRPAVSAVSGGEPSIPSTDAGGEKMDGSSHPGRSDNQSAHISAKSGQATNTNSEMDRATEGSFETGSEAAEKGREAIPAGPEGVDLNHAGAGESPATEKATVATQGEATAPTSDERVSLPVDDRSDAAANAGGDHVDGNALRVPTSVTGEGAASALPAKPKVSFRPNCLQPEMCRSGTRDHCYSCRKAVAQHEDAA